MKDTGHSTQSVRLSEDEGAKASAATVAAGAVATGVANTAGETGSPAAPTTKLDRRQRKTRQAIHRAFEELMAEMHYSAVTVVQIIERADIGRSTFYAHFETKEDLLDDMCADMFSHVFMGVNEFCVGHEDLRDLDLQGKLAHLLFHLRDNYSGVCGKLIAEGEPHFTGRFKSELETLFAQADEAADTNCDVPQELLTAMQASAFIEATTWWFNRGAASGPEQLAAWFCAMIPQWQVACPLVPGDGRELSCSHMCTH